MAASSWNALQPRLGIEGSSIPEIISFPEKATQSFKAGTPVKLTTTAGTVEIATDGTTGFLGIAMEDASGTTNAALKVMVCRPNTPIIARCTVAGTATKPSTVLTQGVAYDWYIDTTDYWFGVDSATDGPVVVYEKPIYDASGVETYWGVFRLLEGQAGNLDEAGA
jgi:hypothetical protein